MSIWNKKPTIISYVNKTVDYIMCIDENGNSNNIEFVLKELQNNKEVSEDDSFFTITGCIFTKEQYDEARIKLEELKRKYWNNGEYYDKRLEKNKVVCLHSRDIRRQENCFNISNYNEFIIDLSEIINKIDCKIISISINLYKYLKEGYTHNIYNVAFDFLLERYIYSTERNKKGIIMLEARGKEEDKKLLEHISKVIKKTGTKKIKSKELRTKIKGVYFNPKWTKEYSSTYIGLEIVDLFSYPIHKYIKRNKKDKAFQLLENKLVGYPNYENKGIKVFPQKNKN